MTFTPPTFDEIKLQSLKIGLPEFEAEKFWNFYESIDWFVGRRKMVRWHMALTGWKLRWQEREARIPRHGGAISPSVQMIKDQKELERVEKRIYQLRQNNKTDSHVDIPWPKEDREEIKALKTRRTELMKTLQLFV